MVLINSLKLLYFISEPKQIAGSRLACTELATNSCGIISNKVPEIIDFAEKPTDAAAQKNIKVGIILIG